MNEVSLEVRNRAEKRGLNGDRDAEVVPSCLRATALSNVLEDLVSLRNTYLTERILMSKADVSDASRNVRLDPDQTHKLCYTVGDLVVIDVRLTIGWSGPPGYSGVLAVAAEHSHCFNSLDSGQCSLKGRR